MKRMHISAEPGMPSTLWVSDTDKCYRTKKEAEQDHGEVINPDDIEIKTSWWTRNKKTVVISAATTLFILAAIFCYVKYYKK